MNKNISLLVSIVIPTFNNGRYLGRAIQSVFDQTYKNWEVIIIDNHSADNTDEVMANFSDPRLRYIKIKNNGVIAVSRNAGLRNAKGEWIAFLDSDDWWKPNKLEVCVASINDKVDFLYHDLEIAHDPPDVYRNKYIKSRQLKNPVVKDLLLKGNTIANTSVVVRKSLLEQVGGISEDAELIVAEDYNTWLKVAQITDRFIHIPLIMGFYLSHHGGASRKDISLPLHIASREFVKILEPREKLIYDANYRYTIALNSYKSGNYSIGRQKLICNIRIGNLHIGIKSLWLFAIMSIKCWQQT
jgi:glycosyltransferase involved in cell wall biosynthesis